MRRPVKMMLRNREERPGCPEEQVQAEVTWRFLWAKRWREVEEGEETWEGLGGQQYGE